MNTQPGDDDGVTGIVYVLHLEPACRHARTTSAGPPATSASASRSAFMAPVRRLSARPSPTLTSRGRDPAGQPNAWTAPRALAQDHAVLPDLPHAPRRAALTSPGRACPWKAGRDCRTRARPGAARACAVGPVLPRHAPAQVDGPRTRNSKGASDVTEHRAA
jgi:hypothetical protein